MPHEYGRQGHHTDEDERTLDCLARYVCNLDGGLPERRRFIAKMQLHKGQAFADDLKVRVMLEWEKRNRRRKR